MNHLAFSQETRFKLSNKYLNKRTKHKLKVERVKEYINSQPKHRKYPIQELIASAGYELPSQYGTGWSFIQGLITNGTITKDALPGKRKGYWTVTEGSPSSIVKEERIEVPNQSTVTTAIPKVKPLSEPDYSSPDGSGFERPEPPISSQIQYDRDIEFTMKVEFKAKEWAWRNNSDSLREFIKGLK